MAEIFSESFTNSLGMVKEKFPAESVTVPRFRLTIPTLAYCIGFPVFVEIIVRAWPSVENSNKEIMPALRRNGKFIL